VSLLRIEFLGIFVRDEASLVFGGDADPPVRVRGRGGFLLMEEG